MIIDIVFAIILVFAFIKGMSKGLIVALFSIAGFIIGLAAALKLSATVAVYLAGSSTGPNKWLPFVSFIIVFAIVLLLVRLGAKLIQKSVEFVMLGWLNRLGGFIFFAILYCLIYSVFLFYITQLHLVSDAIIQSSVTYPYLKPLAPLVLEAIGKVIPIFKDVFEKLQSFFGQAAHTTAAPL